MYQKVIFQLFNTNSYQAIDIEKNFSKKFIIYLIQ